MPRPKWSDPIERAFFDAWIDEAEMPDEMRDQRIETLRKRWGALDSDAFQRGLQEGEAADRLCALFALGYLAPTGVEDLLVPFLSSSVRKERWASAIALGENKDERALSFLQACLLEQMEYNPSQSDREVNKAISNIIKIAQGGNATSILLDHMKDPMFANVMEESQMHRSEYLWYTVHRLTITNLLGAWGDLRAIPSLCLALQKCWEIEQQGSVLGGSAELWHNLEDDLAYALGQLEAWDALNGLELPPTGFQLARMYLVFGYLGIDTRTIYGGDIIRLINMGRVDQDSIVSTLREHFGLTEYVSKASLQDFRRQYSERDGKW